MQDIWDFSRAFFGTFISRVTGGLLAAFLTIWAFFASSSPPAGILWGSLSVYFFLSAFGTWRMERQRAMLAESKLLAREAAEQESLQANEAKASAIHADPFDEISRKFDQLDLWAQQTLKFIFRNKQINAKANLSTQPEIHSPPPDALAELSKFTGWLVLSREGHYSINPTVERHLRRLFVE